MNCALADYAWILLEWKKLQTNYLNTINGIERSKEKYLDIWMEDYCHNKDILITFLPMLFNASKKCFLYIFINSIHKLAVLHSQIGEGQEDLIESAMG
jgi:hypothetical protein